MSTVWHAHNYLFDDDSADALTKCLSTSYLREQPLRVVTETNGLILPHRPSVEPVWGLGGCISGDGTFIDESAGHYCDRRIFGGPYDYDEAGVVEMDEVVLFMGHVTGHWGNFLIDQTARLWYAPPNLAQYKIAYCGIGFEPNSFGASTKNGFEFLSLLGISPDQLIDIRAPTKCREVVVPELAFIPGKYYSSEYRAIYKKAVENSVADPAPAHSKVYFTRGQLHHRKEVGERKLERLFSDNGFVVLAPEKLTVEEQILCVHNCETLVSIEGTLAHNVVFAGSSLNQVILRKQSAVLPRQHLLNQLMNAAAVYVDIYQEPFSGFPSTYDGGPFLLRLNDNLKQFADDNGLVVVRRCGWAGDWADSVLYTYKCLVGWHVRHVRERLARITLLRHMYLSIKRCVSWAGRGQ